MTTAPTAPRWVEGLDIDGLHEPTVRAIIDTMKRTGAGFGARVLEAQYRNGQIADEVSDKVRRMRDLADWLEAHPQHEHRVTTEGSADWWPLRLYCSNVKELHELRRLIGGRWEKDASSATFELKGRIGEAYVSLQIARDTVCTPVVVGTETKLVPDPDAPKVEKEVDVIEWTCPDSLVAIAPVSEPETATEATIDDTIPF